MGAQAERDHIQGQRYADQVYLQRQPHLTSLVKRLRKYWNFVKKRIIKLILKSYCFKFVYLFKVLFFSKYTPIFLQWLR